MTKGKWFILIPLVGIAAALLGFTLSVRDGSWAMAFINALIIGFNLKWLVDHLEFKQ